MSQDSGYCSCFKSRPTAITGKIFSWVSSVPHVKDKKILTLSLATVTNSPLSTPTVVNSIRPVSAYAEILLVWHHWSPYHWKQSCKPLNRISFSFLFPCRWTFYMLPLVLSLALTVIQYTDQEMILAKNASNVVTLAEVANVRYYPTWKHSPLKDYWLTNAHESLTTEWLKY
jgi:hypothetical protein